MGIIRKTKSVETLIQLFNQGEEAYSGVYLVDRLRKKMNKTTVYRILERLEDEGMIHSFTDNDGLTWYAKCNGCSSSHHADLHPHFKCRNCGKTVCLNLDIAIPSIPNRKVDSAEFLLIGVCEKCLT